MRRLLVLQHLNREGPGLFAHVAKKRGLNVRIFRLDLGDELPQINKEDLLLVLGGSMGVKDINTYKYQWLAKEILLIKDALNKGIGIIGVCLGAQLLSKAVGGDVEPLLDSASLLSPEVGWDKIFLASRSCEKIWGSLLDKPLEVLHWHGDRILLPKSAQLIASSNRCKEQLFKIGEFAYGLQFHVEVDQNMIEKWIEEDFEFIQLAIGLKAKEILLAQQEKYGEETLHRRLLVVNKLFEAIGF